MLKAMRGMAKKAARAGWARCPTTAHCWRACGPAPLHRHANTRPGAFARSLGSAASSGGCAALEDIQTLTAAAKRQSHLFPAWLQVACVCSAALARTPRCAPARDRTVTRMHPGAQTELKTDHAGEYGAVEIYRGALLGRAHLCACGRAHVRARACRRMH